MTDTPKKSWFDKITPALLGRVGGGVVDKRAADEFAGNSQHRFDPEARAKTQDLYGQAEESRDALRRR